MTSGFGAVPDDLRQSAGKIGEVIGGVAGLVWQGPSGDYGHAAVQSGWARFIEGMKGTVQGLHDKAGEHGESLRTAASAYEGSEAEAGTKIGDFGEAVAAADDGMVGGGFGGPVRGGMAGGSGFLDPAIIQSRLDPGADPGSWENTGAVY
ncbi:hypothetical protein [Amycolatopsis pigmentata]|uniref:Excreted virulence factor EspC (Type VII ESX diderm) n=1 Tax=Amycolatopsis pigmentata TaxID=450801 RepID=A0ABW5G1Z4_9PSEU